ncbi:MAG: hypothetical protein PF495_12525, partial [Spirochaetales bacterium]|nr:hypothetical protein [Spirochaetales bacterium]
PETDLFVLEQQWQRPDLSGRENLMFELTALAYAILTGESPVGTVRVKQDGYQAVPIELFRPDLSRKTALWFSERLERKPKIDQSLEQWIAGFKSVITLPKTANPPDNENNLKDFIEKQNKRAAKTESRRIHKTRNRIAAGIAIILIAVVISFTKSALEPSPTAGLDQEDLIRYYYNAHNSLDPMAVQDALTRGVKSSYDQMLTYLYVSSSVRTAYEHKSGFISAEVWLSEGKPEVEDSVIIFGITDLKLRRIDNDSFYAEYTLWSPLGPEERAKQGTPSIPIHVAEELDLRKKGSSWLIEKINQRKPGID